jgi:alpha-N-arabinofuranosidase
MHYRIVRVAAAFLVAVPAASILHGQAAPTLNIDINRPKAVVSPTLYGLMTEEINYSYDGGLYAELVRNRTFRSDWTGILNWFLVEKGSASARVAVDNREGPSTVLHTSAKIEVTKADAGSPAGLLNEGYWGIAVQPNMRYKGSLFAKNGSADPLPVRIALVGDQTGQVLAETSVPVNGTGWKEYKFEMRSGNVKAASDNHLELTVNRPATLWLQMVSLFPPTYHDRPNGNRIDIMEKLAAMHPSFLRFPGGNYLEGGRISERFDWKKMIGPLVDRPTPPDYVELSVFRRHGHLRVSGVVRGPAHAATSWGFRRLLPERRTGEAGSGSRTIRTGGPGRDRVCHRRNGNEVGRPARPRRASSSLRPAVHRDRQRRQFRQTEDL